MPHNASDRPRRPGHRPLTPAVRVALVMAVGLVVLAAYLLTRATDEPATAAAATTAGTSTSRTPGAGPGTGGVTPSRPASPTTARPGTPSPPGTDPVSRLRWVAETALPAEARDTLARIRAGGPYRYPRNDDQTFGNREGLLPAKPSGYYREYTVLTPGSQDRGARRIIAGRDGDRYYTDDHYRSFRRIQEGT